jgi:type I restriction enzyme S subunit
MNGRIDVTDVDFVGEKEYERMKQRCGPESGDVLISCSGTIGRIAVVPDNFHCVLVRSAALAKINPAKSDGYFVQYWLQGATAQSQIAASVNQGAQPNLFLNHIERLLCPCPPLPEQRAIASALGDVDALLAALDAQIAKQRDLKQATMQQLLTGQTRLPGFTGEWEVRRLDHAGHCLRGVSYQGDSDLSLYDTDNTKRLLRSNNIQESAVVVDDVQYVNAARVSRQQILRQDDIVICMANGSKSLVGKSGRFTLADGHDYTFGAFMGCFRTEVTKAHPGFLFLLFQTDRYRDYIANLLAGSSINNLRPGSIESLEFRMPPIPEQTAIATVLDAMEAELVAFLGRRAKTAALKQSMMQTLLTGRIRLVEPAARQAAEVPA